jgi:hypothetical protein
MLKHSIRRLNTALKENPSDYYDYIIKITDNIKLPPKPNLPKDLKNEPKLAENSGSICNECFGSGLVPNAKTELYFKITICKKCKGTGFL